MSLLLKIDNDIKQAMRDRAADRLNVLRMFKSALKYHTIEKAGVDAQATEEDVVTIARREIKKRRDSVDSYTSAGRADLADKELAEVKVLEEFLPPALSTEEIEAMVKQAIAETGATSKAQMGAVMKALQVIAAGRVEGKVLNQTVQKLLS